MFVMVFGGHGKVSAASTSQHTMRDKIQKVEPIEHANDALLTENTSLYRICNARPERIIPIGFSIYGSSLGKLSLIYKTKFYQSLLCLFRGMERLESAPVHFDVASRYYVICLRHLLC